MKILILIISILMDTRYDFTTYDDEILKEWHVDLPKYSTILPPPNVTGKLHMGHALNTTIQDVIMRWKKLQGYDICWLSGINHAGIVTQAKVKK